jgi:hypothetical protein
VLVLILQRGDIFETSRLFYLDYKVLKTNNEALKTFNAGNQILIESCAMSKVFNPLYIAVMIGRTYSRQRRARDVRRDQERSERCC